jgi:hypothetical protein
MKLRPRTVGVMVTAMKRFFWLRLTLFVVTGFQLCLERTQPRFIQHIWTVASWTPISPKARLTDFVVLRVNNSWHRSSSSLTTGRQRRADSCALPVSKNLCSWSLISLSFGDGLLKRVGYFFVVLITDFVSTNQVAQHESSWKLANLLTTTWTVQQCLIKQSVNIWINFKRVVTRHNKVNVFSSTCLRAALNSKPGEYYFFCTS